MAIRVRAASIEDAAAIGRVHVAGWRAAYAGLMPDAFLAGLDPALRAATWRERLGGPGDFAILVAEREAAVVGFTSAGTELKAPSGGEVAGEVVGQRVGQVFALYVEPAVWGSGAGGALLAAAEQYLGRRGFRRAVLWVLPGNARARRFYGRAGWAPDGERREDEVDGLVLEQLRYAKDLTDMGR
jgi:GNAT superfamily N-acetyltransferase